MLTKHCGIQYRAYEIRCSCTNRTARQHDHHRPDQYRIKRKKWHQSGFVLTACIFGSSNILSLSMRKYHLHLGCSYLLAKNDRKVYHDVSRRLGSSLVGGCSVPSRHPIADRRNNFWWSLRCVGVVASEVCCGRIDSRNPRKFQRSALLPALLPDKFRLGAGGFCFRIGGSSNVSHEYESLIRFCNRHR